MKAHLRNLQAPTLLLLALLAFANLTWFVIATHRIPTSADQAVVGLMGKHILENQGHPVFYYGATYAGSLEPHYVAAIFAILGPTPAAYRLSMVMLVLLTLAGVWWVTRRNFGRTAALCALAYLAIPPYFFLYKGLTSDGAYDSVALLSLAIVSLALWLDEGGAGRRRAAIVSCVLGLFMGLAFWVMPYTAAVSGVVFGWLLLRPRTPARPLSLSFLSLGVAIGAAPWWIWNLRHNWASVKAPELGTVGLGQAVRNLAGLAWVSFPTLEGGMHPSPDVGAMYEVFPLSRALVIAVSLVLVLPSLTHVARDRRGRLLIFCLLALFSTACFSRRLILTEPRYLFSYYVFSAPLLGALLAATLSGRRRALALTAAAILLAIHAASVATSRVSYRNVDAEVTGPLRPLIANLEGAGLNRVYANYWTAYRLSFESNERIIATPIPGEEAVRYLPYNIAVGGTPEAAFVLLPPRSGCFESFLRENNLAYERTDVREFAIFSKVAPAALDFVRRFGALPLPAEGYRVAWRIESNPSIIPADGQATARVSFLNQSPCLWPRAVHLGYHWRALAPGREFIRDGGRAIPDRRVEPAEWVTVEVSLKAPRRPGRYSLEYDLVLEQVKWFSERGGAIASVPIDIR
jgi:4-amino-4-deoxy-L-arabinose transferase-like glycosyltransferase